MNNYLRYWGKAKPADHSAGNPCHLLPYHCLDVAAVGACLLDSSSSFGRPLVDALGVPEYQFKSIFSYLLAIHDLGKFSQSFQALASPEAEVIKKPDAGFSYDVPGGHAALGWVLWRRSDVFKENRVAICGWPEQTPPRRTARRAMEALLETSFGHHGQPVEAGSRRAGADFLKEDEQAACSFAMDVARLMRPDWPIDWMSDEAWSQKLRAVTWQLAGLAVLADWLGSDQSVFSYVIEPMSLEAYWQEYALPRARLQVRRLGFDHPKPATAFPGVRDFFGFEPTPLQQWAEEVELSSAPQLFILEDVTGAGKTEASVTLAHRLLSKGLAHGVYFGLPTMATSNAMYSRISTFYQRWYDSEETPSLVLAHGAQKLHEGFQASVIPGQPLDSNYLPEERSASALCNQWFADSRKRALLADVGVGTVDQVLMAVLPFRHQSLRMVGLAGKVLIVDEIHACDDYMLTLLCAVLELHARQGGYAVLLTATMPLEMREKLLKAWRKGLGVAAEQIPLNASFPLATSLNHESMAETPLPTRPSVARALAVEHLDQSSQALDLVVGAAQRGQCACWIRNTVDDAIEAYEAIRARVDEPDKVLLFHSRFTMADRQRIENQALDWFGKHSGFDDRAGRILIGTQVLEQSLDICMDVMVSDLAPIDLLIQRAGRLHRHRRDSSGNLLSVPNGEDQRQPPVLRVLAPSFTFAPAKDWVSRFLPGTAAVYRNHGQLWLTLQALVSERVIWVPERARWLIEAVYGPEADEAIPEQLKGSYFEYEGEKQSQSAMAQFNRLDLDKGYEVSSARCGWQAEVDIGTRLTDEPSVKITLVQLDDARQRLLPVAGGPHPWEMSQVSVRQSLADKLPELPEEWRGLQDALFERHPGLRFSRLWLGPFDMGDFRYSPSMGMYRPRKAGNYHS